jgi:hypothetical protein
MLNEIKKRLAVNRLVEEEIYQQVHRELQNGMIREGLWAKALAKCGGDEEKAKSLYISFRAQSLADQSLLIEEEKKSQDRLVQSQKRLEKESIEKALDENARQQNNRSYRQHTEIPIKKNKIPEYLAAFLIVIMGLILFFILVS